MTTLQYINTLHKTFLIDLLHASQLDERPESSFPTVIFLTFAFVLIHSALHRRSSYIPPPQLYFYRELGFQWSFFYVTRLWFLCIKGVHWISRWFKKYLYHQHLANNILWVEYLYIRAGLLTVLTLVGLIPFFIFTLSYFWKNPIPNFLMWVGEDPWVRSEIGISGHYLDRPPNFITPKRREYAYRAKRSMSLEYDTHSAKMIQPPRNCRSLAFIDFS